MLSSRFGGSRGLLSPGPMERLLRGFRLSIEQLFRFNDKYSQRHIKERCEIVHRAHCRTLCAPFDVPHVAQTVAGGHSEVHLGKPFLLATSHKNLTESLLN